MRSFNIDNIYIDDLINTRMLPDIFNYRCITKDSDILNKKNEIINPSRAYVEILLFVAANYIHITLVENVIVTIAK